MTAKPPAGSAHYQEGWRDGYEQALIDRERAVDAVQLTPETGQVGRCGTRPPRLIRRQRLANVPVCTLPAGHAGWHRDTDSRAEWGQVRDDEHPGVAALLRRCDEVERSRGRRAGSHISIAEVRALLGRADNGEGERRP